MKGVSDGEGYRIERKAYEEEMEEGRTNELETLKGP